MQRFGVQSSARASFYLYTTRGRRSTPSSSGLEHTRSYFGGPMDLDALYQEIILDHYKRPHHAGLREPYDTEMHHVNPTCGDEMTLRVRLAGDTVADVSYDADGLLDQPGLRVGDVRPGDRQDRSRRR